MLHGRLQEASARIDQLNKQALRLRSRNVRLRAGVSEREDDRPRRGSQVPTATRPDPTWGSGLVMLFAWRRWVRREPWP